MDNLSIEARIEHAKGRHEESLNLSFPIGMVKQLCEKFEIDPRKDGVGILVKKILDAVEV